MNPLIVLEIAKVGLELALEIIRGIPIESRQAMWKEHEKRIEFWEDLAKRALKEMKEQPTP